MALHTGWLQMIRQALIKLEFEVEDCLQAKIREREIKALLDGVGTEFRVVQMRVIERRRRRGKRAPAPSAVFMCSEPQTIA